MTIPLSQYWSLLARYLKGQIGLFVLLALVLLSSIGLKLLIPQITRLFIDGAAAGKPVNHLMMMGLAFIGVAALQQLFATGATWTGEVVAWNATNKLRVDLADHSLQLDMAFHKSKTPGEMIERLDEDVTAMARFFSQLVVIIGGDIILVLGVLAMLFLENKWLGLAFSIFAIPSLLLLNRLREIAVPYEIKRREVIADLYGYLEERISGTEDIRSCGAIDYIIHGLYRIQSDLLVIWKRVQIRYWALGVVSRTIIILGYGMSFVFSFYLIHQGSIGMGTAFMIVQYMNMLARPLRQISDQIQELQGVGASIERINELIDERSSIHEGNNRIHHSGAPAIEFENVTFGYEPDDPIIKKVSFHLASGRILGILGRTGSGKTTLIRLLCRLYDSQKGVIRIAGMDVKQICHEELRGRVAMVTQDVQLFEASVRDNLTFFDDAIADGFILDVLKQVELWNWYKTLPHGLDTRLETGGRSMSAGEAQLLAFARIFLKNPDVVILDEASSRLDPATEMRIERAMERLLVNRTAIIIAHRLGTIQKADDILIFQDGEIIEQGSRESLLMNPESRFASLLKEVKTTKEDAA